MTISLEKTKLNRKYYLSYINNNSSIKNRLKDIGLIKGTSIVKVLVSPFGGISAYSILGSLISIRDKDAKGIMVKYE